MRDQEFDAEMIEAARQLRNKMEEELARVSKKLSRKLEIKEYLINVDVPGVRSQVKRADYIADEIYSHFEGSF